MRNDLASLSAAAEAVGVNKSTLSRQLAEGLFVNYGSPTRPLVSIAEVRKARQHNVDPAKQRNRAEPDAEQDPEPAVSVAKLATSSANPPVPIAPAREDQGPSLNDIRRDTAALEHERRKLQLARDGGKLIDRHQAAHIFNEIGRQVRDQFEGMADRFAAQFGADIAVAVREEGRTVAGNLASIFARALEEHRRNVAT
jgi:hypothetical protein